MKNLALFVLFLLTTLSVLAEDIIVCRDGNIIKSQVLEVGVSEIKYKKISNLQGPTYCILKSDVLSVNYENGEVDKMTQDVTSVEDNSKETGNSVPIASTDNESIRNSYNSIFPIRLDKKDTNGNTNYGYAYWGIGDNSIMSTSQIEIGFEMCQNSCYFRYPNGGYMVLYPYCISILNKTNSPIYIDLGNTYRVSKNESNTLSEAWYDGTSFVENKSKSNSIGLGLGAITNTLGIGGLIGGIANGISLGKSSGAAVAVDKSLQRVISVAPHGKIILPAHLSADNESVIETYELMEIETQNGFKNKLNIRKWGLNKYNEGDLPWAFDYYITYSSDPNFSSSYTVPVHLFVRGIYGVGKMETLTKYNDGNERAINKRYNFDNNSKVLFTRIHLN